jgi:hypothetical protein
MTSERVTDPDDLFAKMVEQNSDEMLFGVTREPTSNTTELFDAMKLFIVARIKRRFDEATPGAPGVSALRVNLSLSLDGEQPRMVDDDQYPFLIVDGKDRRDAMN